ncbi:hypothetical protein ACFSFW_24100 [Fredinandcohnia salidurans]|uniref:Bacterial CdiA-CT RNAse A domain-containing protein n=1 Tax=Fredinandcohnia salidurans TaxID=2595041 RepID=A0ABW4MW19_9BACI
MFFFNKEDVYIGFSMEELSKVRAILEREGIKSSYKTIDPSGKWLGPGTSRGNFGSFGINKNFEKQYVVSVRKKDAGNAKYFINSVLYL